MWCLFSWLLVSATPAEYRGLLGKVADWLYLCGLIPEEPGMSRSAPKAPTWLWALREPLLHPAPGSPGMPSEHVSGEDSQILLLWLGLCKYLTYTSKYLLKWGLKISLRNDQDGILWTLQNWLFMHTEKAGLIKHLQNSDSNRTKILLGGPYVSFPVPLRCKCFTRALRKCLSRPFPILEGGRMGKRSF